MNLMSRVLLYNQNLTFAFPVIIAITQRYIFKKCLSQFSAKLFIPRREIGFFSSSFANNAVFYFYHDPGCLFLCFKRMAMALSKGKIKYVQSLKDKKHRVEEGAFVAEGMKLVSDLLDSCKCKFVAALPGVAKTISRKSGFEIVEASEEELKKASFLKTPPQIIGVFYQPRHDMTNLDLSRGLHLVLDGVQDPGNMGTIVRLADWFGIDHIFCSPDTVDIYNPKTIQATMGAVARVKIHYVSVETLFVQHAGLPVYGTFLDGENIYSEHLSENGFIVMGSEGGGISPGVEKLIANRLFIPNYPAERKTSESLNVAGATAIVLSEFRRRCSAR